MCFYCKDIYQDIDNFVKLEGAESILVSGDPKNIQDPLFSIIITCYKRKDYLHEAINSALNQENVDFAYEIIVICDDPESELQEINNYKNIKNIFFYKNTKNIGLYNSSNLGAKIARGAYIAFLHDDDILFPEYLSEINNFLQNEQRNAKCVLVNRSISGQFKKKAMYRNIIKTIARIMLSPLYFIRFLLRKKYKKITLREGLTYLLSNIYKAPSCGTLFEREYFIKTGGFNQDFWPVSDYYFFLKFNQNCPVYMLIKKLACYRWLENLSQDKDVQLSGFEHYVDFFSSEQPFKSVNNYYSFFHVEVLYSKYLMVCKEYRNEIKIKYPELKQFSATKWILFMIYNKAFKFFHDIM